MLFFIIVLIIVGLFLQFTGIVKISLTSTKDMQERVDFLSLLEKGDRIDALKFNSELSVDIIRRYDVVRNDVDRKELFLKYSYNSAFIAKYSATEFKDVIERNGDLVITIMERIEKRKNESK